LNTKLNPNNTIPRNNKTNGTVDFFMIEAVLLLHLKK
jgi:hypothetical protein